MENNEFLLFLVLLFGVTLLIASDPSFHRVRDIPPIHISTTFQNGSVLLLSPIAQLRTTFEKLICGTPITHVGIVCYDATGTPFLFHTVRKGAHLVPLRVWIERHLPNNQVFLRRVVGSDNQNLDIHPQDLENAFQPLLGYNYSYGFWKAVLGRFALGVELPLPIRPDDRFCSELVADVLSRVGVLNFTTSSPRLVLPRDFWDTPRMPFVNGCTLAPPEEVFM
jgi:hypothetical protein